MKSDRWLGLLLAALGVALALGTLRLFLLRFAAGDVYPPYSSLRTDPLGAKAFYESLGNLPPFVVSRNYQPVTKLLGQPRQSIFFLGVHIRDLQFVAEEEARTLENLAASGDRLVVALFPATEEPRRAPPEKKPTPPNQPPKKKKNPKPPRDNAKSPTPDEWISLEERWGFHCAYDPAATNATWHSRLYFDKLDAKWRVLESRGTRAALVERDFASGTIVLCADSYPVSNEAMRSHRRPELLATLLGPNRRVVFDETHLGVGEDPGVMTLARKYGLHGLLAGLALLAALFIWKNSVSFVPARSDETEPGVVLAAGKDSAAGFVNLLRRSIPMARLLAVCLDEWEKSFASRRKKTDDQRQRLRFVVAAQNALPAARRDPVAGYREIAEILQKRK